MILEEFEKYHEVDLLDFQKYILSIGFETTEDLFVYKYKQYRIQIFHDMYFFDYVPGWCFYGYNDLTPFNKYLKHELRSIKLKKILG